MILMRVAIEKILCWVIDRTVGFAFLQLLGRFAPPIAREVATRIRWQIARNPAASAHWWAESWIAWTWRLERLADETDGLR